MVSNYLPFIDDEINDKIYDALRSENLEDGVMAALDILRTKHNEIPSNKHFKDEFKSNYYRKQGNAAYSKNEYQMAMVLYNQALLMAPKHSLAMKLAYSNRSAVLYDKNYFTACLKDINTCISMGCPPEVTDKLRKRKQGALNKIPFEQSINEAIFPPIFKDFFQLKTFHADIHNISSDVKITIESAGVKIVATKDINPGTVLALETPFVKKLHQDHIFNSCHYCHKMALNLMPCQGCCYALYCNEICKQNSWEEDHSVLCPLFDEIVLKNPDITLAIKAVIKLRQRTKSWEEFMSANCEADGQKKDILDVFNCNKSVWIDSNRHFTEGKLYTYSWDIAIIVYWIDIFAGFFPKSHDAKQDAIRAAARIAINFSLNANYLLVPPVVTIKDEFIITKSYHPSTNYQWSSFIGTFKHSCQPNVLPVPQSKKVALLCMMPVKKGAELTISRIGNYQEEDWVPGNYQTRLFITQGIACNCIICSGSWLNKEQSLTNIQKKKFQELDSFEFFKFESKREMIHKKLFEALGMLSGVPFSEEYKRVSCILNSYVLLIKGVNSGNCIFHFIDKDKMIDLIQSYTGSSFNVTQSLRCPWYSNNMYLHENLLSLDK